MFSIKVGREFFLHRQGGGGGINLSLKTIGTGVVYRLFVQMKIRNC